MHTVVEAVRDAGGYIQLFETRRHLHPDIGELRAHLSWSGEKLSEDARLLIDKMGGKGGIVHIGGIPQTSLIERLDGLKTLERQS